MTPYGLNKELKRLEQGRIEVSMVEVWLNMLIKVFCVKEKQNTSQKRVSAFVLYLLLLRTSGFVSVVTNLQISVIH